MERAMDKFDDYELNGRRIKVGKLLIILNKNLRCAAYREQVEPRQIPEPLQVPEPEKILRGEIPQQRPPWPGLPLTLQGPQQISFSLQVSEKWIQVIQESQSLWIGQESEGRTRPLKIQVSLQGKIQVSIQIQI